MQNQPKLQGLVIILLLMFSSPAVSGLLSGCPSSAGEVQNEKWLKLLEHLDAKVKGSEEAKRAVLIGLLTNSAVLLEGPPGVAKTTLIKSLAAATTLNYEKIQNTPDLNPAEIKGEVVTNISSGERVLEEGQLLRGEIVFADELNRAMPKVQASYLEAMSEKVVTVNKVAKPVQKIFFFVAAQNPASSREGNFELSSAQKDRFILSVGLSKPSREHKRAYLLNPNVKTPDLQDNFKLDREDILTLQAKVEEVQITPEIVDKVLDLVEEVEGFSPSSNFKNSQMIEVYNRAEESLIMAARANAFIEGRKQVDIDDIKNLAVPVLRHRVVLQPSFKTQNKTIEEVIREIANDI
ncbi:MAG: MoxR family ATPase [Bdellovibrionota bacterium]|nr:MoxR family ATPase [Bdellovibrionota bacterium]